MFDFITGTFHGRSGDHVTVVVQGVGYAVLMPAKAVAALGERGTTVTVWCHMRQPEGEPPRLYGFASADERDLFRMATDVQGVGPRSALSLLSHFTVPELARAIAEGDQKAVARAKGIGPKLATRMVLELKDKAQVFLTPAESRPAGTVALETARAALEALGYTTKEAAHAAERALKKIGADADVEALLKAALQEA